MSIEKVSNTGLVANNLMFILADMIEVCKDVADSEFAKANMKMDAKTKKALSMIYYGAKDMRKRTIETDDKNQEQFGTDSEKLFKLMLTAIDRTGESYKPIDLIINFAESMQSQTGINISKFGVQLNFHYYANFFQLAIVISKQSVIFAIQNHGLTICD